MFWVLFPRLTPTNADHDVWGNFPIGRGPFASPYSPGRRVPSWQARRSRRRRQSTYTTALPCPRPYRFAERNGPRTAAAQPSEEARASGAIIAE